MNYSINEVANKFGISAHTLRYYDKEGLMPFVGRDKSGKRVFTEEDLNWLAMIFCLKETGIAIKGIKQYADWCTQGMQTLDERKAMLSDHRQQVLKQIEAMKKNLELIDSKIAVYENPKLAKKLYGELDRNNN